MIALEIVIRILDPEWRRIPPALCFVIIEETSVKSISSANNPTESASSLPLISQEMILRCPRIPMIPIERVFVAVRLIQQSCSVTVPLNTKTPQLDFPTPRNFMAQ
jgi:hypothetical protein